MVGKKTWKANADFAGFIHLIIKKLLDICKSGPDSCTPSSFMVLS